ncbi:MAG: MG2 domain-containing protein [Candidatus Peregrinibacteria bacterium]|nr:MG2 domain-containing protein [Candidatus Peregrinibacteria bacterium]MDZ4244597.1 MG2 domain-containing protein [Candidatus Gracilibacteria bacterium]
MENTDKIFNLTKTKLAVIGFVIVAVLCVAAFFTFFNSSTPLSIIDDGNVSAASFVSGEISQGAPIVIKLPEEVDQTVKEQIVFEPLIAGEWKESDFPKNENVVVFQPSKVLTLGSTYSLSIPVQDASLTQYFEIVEPPRILNVFPNSESETSEDSEITIVFNRPMVPLTTLDEMDKQNIDVTIMPPTEGKWKWISTRSLQFQPTVSLAPSSNYKVTTGSSFQSLDGISVEPYKHTFTTRPLRFENSSQNKLAYNQPILITYNQPIDVEKTLKNATIKNLTTNKKVEVIGEYYTHDVYDYKTRKTETRTEESVLAIYQVNDAHNRTRLWDFTNKYEFEILKSFPKQGDINLDEKITGNVEVSDIVQNKSAQSDRSDSVNFDFFDPEGVAVFQFYEDINLAQSSIQGKHIKNIEYVEECNDEIEYRDEETCEKKINKSKVNISFNSKEVALGEKFNLSLDKIVNQGGITINVNQLNFDLTAFPKFEILSTVPGEGAQSTTQFAICSNSPIATPNFYPNSESEEAAKIGDYITANYGYSFNQWGDSYLIDEKNGSHYKCKPDQFQTNINHGLDPNSNYEINLHLTDEFEQVADSKAVFKTGNLDPHALNFYNFQEKYSVATPNATKLTFATKNMTFVDMDICQVPKRDMLSILNKGLYYTDTVDQSLCEWSTRKRIELPKKYWEQNSFQVVLADYVPTKFGHYVVSFSHPDYKDWGNKKVYEHTFVTMTNLSVIEKEVQIREDKYTKEQEKLSASQKDDLYDLYWVTDALTLSPIEGAMVTTYTYDQAADNMTAASNANTRTDGTVKLTVSPNKYGAIVSNKIDSAIVGDFENQLSWGSYANNSERIFLYTDRPIYRPGDTVQLKGVYRIGYDGAMQTIPGKEIELKISDSKYDNVFKGNLKLNDFGTFNTSFVLDNSASLGSYTARVGYGSARFDVEEYTPAAFKLELTPDKEEYINKDTLNLDVQADYYFGVPLEGGSVNYTLSAQDYFFDKYTDEYFNFGSSWYRCSYYCNTNDKYLLSGEATLDSKGHTQITKSLDFDSLFADDKEDDENIYRSRIFVLNIGVTDKDGRQISSQESFVVHGGEVYLGVQTDKYFMQANEEFNLKVKSLDTQGNQVSQRGIKGQISKVTWDYNKRKEVDGGYYFNAEKKLTSVKKFDLSTNSDGNWNDSFALKDQGEYEVSLEAKDSKGNTIITTSTLYVYGGKATAGLVRPTNDTTLEIINNSSELQPGDTASFMIKNPFEGKVKALISIERGRIFDYEVVEFDQSFYNYQFKIDSSYVPNVFASVVLLSAEPGLKFGETSFQVSTDNKELKINVTTEKQNYLPGETVNLNFDVKNSKGEPLATELSVAVVDMSVLALKGNPHKNPLLYFYQNLPLTIATSANLKNLLHEIDIKTGKGGGGGEDADTKKRGDFKDTAFWRAVITTDANGFATANFTLPDNLTTWQIETLGVTKDTLLGVNYMEIMTKKLVSIVPLKPRFTVPGDVFAIGAKVFNQSDETQKLDVTLASSTLKSEGSDAQSVKLSKGETKTVYFKVSSPSDLQYGEHVFTLSAKNSEFEDVIEQSIQITRNETYESVATASNTNKDLSSEFLFLPKNIIPDEGKLEINASATLAVFLSDALNSILGYPYGCTEQIASKLKAIAIVKAGLKIENIGDKFKIDNIIFDGKIHTLDEVISLGLARITENQNDDGGFGYYKGMKSSLYLTMSTLEALARIEKTNSNIDKNMLKRAGAYLTTQITNTEKYKSIDDLIFVAHSVSSSVQTRQHVDTLKPLIQEKILQNKKVLSEELGNMSLAYLALTMAQNPDTFGTAARNNVFEILENRIVIDARGAHLPGGNAWYYYDTPVKSTATLLSALTVEKRNNEMSGNILRWLLLSRSKDGAWGSTANTAAVVDAFTAYMIAQGENKSDFKLDLKLDGSDLASFDFNKDTILNQESTIISPLNKLAFGKLLPLQFIKKNNNAEQNNFYYDLGLTYFLPIDEITARDEGFSIKRKLFALDENRFDESYEPKNDPKIALNSAKVGEILHGQLEIIVPETRHFVAIEDFIPAGTELVNFKLSTENPSLVGETTPDSQFGLADQYFDNTIDGNGNELRPDREELRDDRLFLFKEDLAPGTYTYDYYIRVLIPGEFHHLPAVISEMYFPENFGRTEGSIFEVK